MSIALQRAIVRKGPITFNDQYRNSPRRPIRIAASMVKDPIRGEAKVLSLCVVIGLSCSKALPTRTSVVALERASGRGHVGIVGTFFGTVSGASVAAIT